MRLVCMVPSLTETLIECGFDVVGRTRYCIHPKEQVEGIAIVGGTKDISWEKVNALNPDLLVFDQEENPKRFADQAPCKWFASHVKNLSDVPKDLQRLHDFLSTQINIEHAAMKNLKSLIQDWKDLISNRKIHHAFSWGDFPGLIEWWNRPEENWKPDQILYLIWRKPWICVSKNTFIGSVLDYLGYKLSVSDELYPKIVLEQCNPKTTLLLYSSEPYPFAEDKTELKASKFYAALIDGENFSWFGARSLRFLVSKNK